MIQHVFERASQSRYLSRVLIATDDPRIFDAARAFGAPALMTSPEHASGTDRAAEVASTVPEASIVVNIQGDEPLIDPQAVDAAVLALLDAPDVPMSTLKKQIDDPEQLQSPHVVKVVTDRRGRAIYFSRHPIPFDRDHPTPHYKHIGLYAYRREFLLRYSELPVGPLEQAERLEQLRALENGFPIQVVETEYESLGVDTPADLDRVARLFSLASLSRKNHG